MTNKKKVLISILTLIVIALIVMGIIVFFRPDKPRTQGSQSVVEKITPTPILTLTHYSNKEFGFSFDYPAEWNLPQETKVTPPQQHFYQIVLNPQGNQYFIDIYRQMMPLPLANFVRDYFAEANWSEEQKINNQNIVKFFLPKSGLEPSGSAGVAFAKGNKEDLVSRLARNDVLVISTSILKGEKEKIINDLILNQIAASFAWGN